MTDRLLPDSHPASALRGITESHEQSSQEEKRLEAAKDLHGFLTEEQCVGDIISMDYDTAEVLIHDRLRRDVGGVPHGCLLLATRLKPDPEPAALAECDLADPQVSLILLRALRSSPLPNDIEMKEARLRAGQRAAQTEHNWDEGGKTDLFTLDQMRYAGAHCRILGTFRMATDGDSWNLRFGGDIDNFYAGQGLKVYKPVGESLGRIINHRRTQDLVSTPVRIGIPRYAASAPPSGADSPGYELSVRDLVAQRTALFGMTRTGKSNTTKTIASAIHRLRWEKEQPLRVGQLILDPNGEYANDNPQDDHGCLRRVSEDRDGESGQVVTFGMVDHPNDQDRRITKFNFYGGDLPEGPAEKDAFNDRLQALYRGKSTLDSALQGETAGYIRKFVNADLHPPPDVDDHGQNVRYRRLLFFYRAILASAGFARPSWRPRVQGLFSKEIREKMSEDTSLRRHVPTLEKHDPTSWDLAAGFAQDFAKWTKTDMFKNFDNHYAQHHDQRSWSDERLLDLLAVFDNTRGRSLMRDAHRWHSPDDDSDYILDLVERVRHGDMVILDQALGDPEMNRIAGEQIARHLFQCQQRSFVSPKINRVTREVERPPPVIIYAEEAHTLLPKGEESDTGNIWSRIAKEGAKFNIGLVYSTQEPSSIQTNILKNTENWLIAHLNNSDELREVAKYNDFADFKDSILKVREVGLLRVRTLSSPFTVPVQIDKFVVGDDDAVRG